MDKDDFEPKWPQRPDSEKGDEENNSADKATPKRGTPAPSSWTSHNLGAGTPGANDPKATRAIPMVDGSSRFERPGAKSKGQEQGARVTPQQPAREQASGSGRHNRHSSWRSRLSSLNRPRRRAEKKPLTGTMKTRHYYILPL